MTNVTTYHHNTMGQFNSNNLRTQTTIISDICNVISSFIILIVAVFVGISTSIMQDEIDKKPVLPFTTFDTCTSSNIAKSPTTGNIINRSNSYNNIVLAV
jgi:hypothetical protein